MNELNEFMKLIAAAKAADPKHQKIKEVKNNIKEDLNSLFGELATLKTTSVEPVIEDVKPESEVIKLEEQIPEIKTPEERADDVTKYLAAMPKDSHSFQQPVVPTVSPDIKAITDKLKYLEQWVAKISATGPGGGEVNLRFLDDVDRSSIGPGKYLTYNSTTKKFTFSAVEDIDNPAQIQSDWTQADDTQADFIKHKPTLIENLVDLNDIDVSTIQDNYFLKYNAAKQKFEFVEIKAETAFNDTSEPMGHANLLESAISFDDSTRVFTISPVAASYTVYTKGTKRVITDTRTVTIPNATGLYYIYFDTAGVLQYKTTFFDWPNDCMTAYVYYNAEVSKGVFVADERHGITLDWASHEYLHRTRGAAYASGFAISNYILDGDGSLPTHMQLDLNGGTFFDEDLQVDIVHSNIPAPNTWQQDLQGPAKIPMFYRINDGWVIDAPTDYPVKQGTVLPRYNVNTNGTWSVEDIDNNKFGVTFILATNNINYPVIGVIGQASHANQLEADAVDFNELNLTGFPVVELRPLYKLTFDTKTAYTNVPHARLTKVTDLRNISSVQLAV